MPTPQSDYLYRIVDFGRALDVFATEQLHFARPSEWDDPFETLLRHPRTHAIFAQCWCKTSVSDAMWKVYSPKRESVRLRTTRAKLDTLASSHTEDGLSFWIRDVAYKTPTQVRASLLRLTQRLRETYSVPEAADALFLKRKAFDYENEVRVVVHDEKLSDSAPLSRSMKLTIQPHNFIESIMFDPRVDSTFYGTSKRHLEAVVGFKGSIGKSALYRPQKQLVVE